MSATTVSASPQGARLPVAALCGLLAGSFLTMIDSSIVNVALPDIARALRTSLDGVQWIVSGYLLALAAGLSVSAYLAKRFGTRRVYLASLLGFTLASALCALAPTIGALIAARAVQGALGAPLVPLAMGMLLGRQQGGRKFPPAAGMVLFLAPALGPTVGGLLIHLAGWPVIFLVNLPFGIIGALGVRRVPVEFTNQPDHTVRFDLMGLCLLSGGLVLASYGTTVGPQRGWIAPNVWPYWAGGALLLGAYVLWAVRRAHPAVDLKLLRHPQTALAIGLCTIAAVVMFAMVVLAPIFLENLQGHSALVAGLALLPQGIITGFGTALGNRLDVRRIRASVALGMATLAASTAALLLVQVDTPVWVTALLLSGRGLAIGLIIQPLLNMLIGELSPQEAPDGNTLFNVAQRLGGAVGISLLISFFQIRERARVASVLNTFGINAATVGQSSSGAGLASLPADVRAQLGAAAVRGFHDAVGLLVALALVGVGAACFLRVPATAAVEQETDTWHAEAA